MALQLVQEKLSSNKEPSDKMLGQLVVLLQYKWPEHEQTFWHVIEILKQRKVFCYLEFFKYVISIQ